MNTTNTQSPLIDPAKLTFGQIVKTLTPAHIVAIVAVLMALLAAAYSFGTYMSGADKSVQMASLTTERGQCQTNLSIAQQQIVTLTQTNAQLAGTANTAGIEIGTLRQQLTDASVAKAGQANCDFIHAQIKAAEHEIDALRDTLDVFGGGKDPDAGERVKALDVRIAGYQAQLGGCSSHALSSQANQ